MKFTEAEVRFLISEHPVEHATRDGRVFKTMVDVRALGCPEPIFERVLEDRARKLGNRFVEFRSSNRTTVTAQAQPDAATLARASSLF